MALDIGKSSLSISLQKQLDSDLKVLSKNKDKWASLSIADKISYLSRVRARVAEIADTWIERDLAARNVDPNNWDSNVSITLGPLFSLRIIRLYLRTLLDIQKGSPLKHTGKFNIRSDGKTSLDVFPTEQAEKALFMGVHGALIFEEGVNESNLLQRNVSLFKKGGVSLILGAGNLSGIAVADILHKLIADNEVVLFKVHPILEYLVDILSYIFKPLIDAGFVRITVGEQTVGKYLCAHPDVDSIHITGSNQTYQHIIDSIDRKEKYTTGEHGNVSPVIVLPGPWTNDELKYLAEKLAVGMMLNCGFNCNANKVLIFPYKGLLRELLLKELYEYLERYPPNAPFYPGVDHTYEVLSERYPQMRRFGEGGNKEGIPWVFVPHLSPDKEEWFYRYEAFGPFMGETVIKGRTIEDFLHKAVDFSNNVLWGTLNITFFIHPKLLSYPNYNKMIQRTIDELQYGTVCINALPGISFFIGTTAWGGSPRNVGEDIQSGNIMVHNTFMLEGVEKSILTGPFREFPKPFWYPSHHDGTAIAMSFLNYEKERSLPSLAKLIFSAIRY